MRHILCSRSLSSLLFANLLRDMLVMRDSSIIWKETTTSNGKITGVLDMDAYTHEHLLAEYERRYGRVTWFHDHTEAMEQLRTDLQEIIVTSQEAGAEYFSDLAEAILGNRLEEVKAYVTRRRAPSALQLLTSSFAKARMAA